MQNEYTAKSAVLRHRADDLRGNSPNIESTARRLELMHWTPELLHPVEGFLTISGVEVAAEVNRILAMSDDETMTMMPTVGLEAKEARLTQASMLVNAAELLWRLRADEPEAWDQVNELYEDD